MRPAVNIQRIMFLCPVGSKIFNHGFHGARARHCHALFIPDAIREEAGIK
jgi:hypothetical protein